MLDEKVERGRGERPRFAHAGKVSRAMQLDLAGFAARRSRGIDERHCKSVW